MPIVDALKALGNDRRLQILEWLKDPRAHFREQVDGDLVDDGVCGVLIAEKLAVSQPTLSEHMRILVAGRPGHRQADQAVDLLPPQRGGHRQAEAGVHGGGLTR